MALLAGLVEKEEGKLYNTYVCVTGYGFVAKFRKLHPFISEHLSPGGEYVVFDLHGCKCGILICYDVEFPELPRVLAEQGMQILFVPYWTDTKNAYERVKRCAQARAIENECYVVITGSVGNLPNVENMDIQYSQSAVFTPSDYAFPHDAIAAEATPNTEMALIADLDLDKLAEIRRNGSVRNLQDRRLDLYQVSWTGMKKT